MAGDEDPAMIFVLSLLKQNRRRRLILHSSLNQLVARRKRLLTVCFLVMVINVMSCCSTTIVRSPRSCRRFGRNTGWWRNVWGTYSATRFKKTFRVSRTTFIYILNRIKGQLERKTLAEDPIPPELRLALCLYRLGRGDYYYTIAEMVGLGVSTICSIVREVCRALVENFWTDAISSLMPKSEEEFREKILDMEEMWQFPCCWSALDGCHIPVKCPPGGQESSKEYHNFKNFYSVVLMSLVDSHYRFIWGSCGFPGNSHDSIIFQSTDMWNSIQEGCIPEIGKVIAKINVPPLIVADSAFPLRGWLMKPYTDAILSPQQKYFNYRLSRARMVTEGAYGQLKGRWRVLLRKNESETDMVTLSTLACMVLHNICIDQGDSLSKKLDLTFDPETLEKRDRDEIRELLQMTSCKKVNDTGAHGRQVRDALCQKLWLEKETGVVL